MGFILCSHFLVQMLNSQLLAEALACKLKHSTHLCSVANGFFACTKTSCLTVQRARRSQKQIPKSLDVFGWCTWDAFYFRVSAKGIIDGLRSLKDAGVSPKLLVIDDGGHAARPIQHMSAFDSMSLLTAFTSSDNMARPGTKHHSLFSHRTTIDVITRDSESACSASRPGY